MFDFTWFDCTDFDLLDNASKQKRLFDFIDAKALQERQEKESLEQKIIQQKEDETNIINATILQAQWLWFVGDGSLSDFVQLWVNQDELSRHSKLVDPIARFVHLFNKHIQ